MKAPGLGVDPLDALIPLIEFGLLALATVDTRWCAASPACSRTRRPGQTLLAATPSAVAVRADRPPRQRLPCRARRRASRPRGRRAGAVSGIGVVWQRRWPTAPLRQTQQGTLYKRDRDRLEDDPAIAGPISDAIEPLPDMASLWMALARDVGLLESEPTSERVTAAAPGFWGDNAFHLAADGRRPMARAFAPGTSKGGMQHEGATLELCLPFMRPVVLLWLATLADDEWVATADLDAALRPLAPGRDRPALRDRPKTLAAADDPPRGADCEPKGKGETAQRPDRGRPHSTRCCCAAYQLNLVRTSEEIQTGRRAVQLTPLGRYLLALGPPPPPKPAYEHFLFVQPSFEIIAYRQGLTPAVVGQFSRFAIWSQVGAALAMRLTPESVYRALEGGLTPAEILDLLARHSPRPLPAGVAEAVRDWAGRRERVTYHAAATLVEFASADDLLLALAHWPAGPGPAPVRVSERLVLVEDEAAIPFQRFRMTGARLPPPRRGLRRRRPRRDLDDPRPRRAPTSSSTPSSCASPTNRLVPTTAPRRPARDARSS